MVLDPVEPEAAESLVQRAGEVPVLAYAELVPGADFFVGMPTPPAEDTAGSDLDAARAVILKERRSFTHLPTAQMSERAADVAVGELAGKPVGDSTEHEGVASWLYEPDEVTVNNLTSVVVASGALTLEDLCDGETARRCTSLGLR